jgi:hypothetical protein
MRAPLKKRILILVAALVLGTFAFIILRPKEPSYEGKTITQWLKLHTRIRGIESNDSAVREPQTSWEHEEMAIKAFGTNAIPTLLKHLQAKDTPTKSNLLYLLERRCHIEVPILHAYQRHQMAYRGFDVLGKDARPAASKLAQLATNAPQEIRLYALESLVHVDPDKQILWPVVLHLVKDPDPVMQYFGVQMVQTSFPGRMRTVDLSQLFPTLKELTTHTVSSNAPAATTKGR